MVDRDIFVHDETEVSYLKQRDKRLAEVIEKAGQIEREVIPDLFAALVNSIIGQQISTKAHKTIWDKMVAALGGILDGIGIWTAEMLMPFSMQRRNISSFGDLALLRGMRMVYHHKVISRQLFDRYTMRFSPYASIASLYFWAVAGGANYRGKFFVAVRTTKIVCTPDCPAKPLEKNIMFHDTLVEALQDGYRPCKICMKNFTTIKGTIWKP